jgi:uncharacterized protein (TIGR03086 family)
MSDNLRWYTKALYGFDHVVRLAPADRWDAPAPSCPGWTARHVVGHVVAIQRSIEALAIGGTSTMNPMVDPQRHAGPDPAATWAATRDAVLEALDRPDVLGRTVTTFRGEETIDHALGQNLADTTLHAWDLARALGVDDRLDPGLVARIDAMLRPVIDAMRGPMRYGPAVPLAEPAGAQARLLALAGRVS